MILVARRKDGIDIDIKTSATAALLSSNQRKGDQNGSADLLSNRPYRFLGNKTDASQFELRLRGIIKF
jgi:hypothetical protein